MSVQVDQEDTFSGQLSNKAGTQIWNAGVDGYSTWQATLRVQQIKERLPIKRVLLTFFTGNDFQDNERFLAMQRSPLPGPCWLSHSKTRDSQFRNLADATLLHLCTLPHLEQSTTTRKSH